MRWMIDKGRNVATLLLLTMILAPVWVLGQSEYASEEELIKAAESFIKEENYAKSLPLYSQLVSLYPKNTL